MRVAVPSRTPRDLFDASFRTASTRMGHLSPPLHSAAWPCLKSVTRQRQLLSNHFQDPKLVPKAYPYSPLVIGPARHAWYSTYHLSAQRRRGSGAGTWRVGGFEFGYLLQCGGGGAGREACNVPLDWTTGSTSLLAGVLLRLGQIAGRDFEGSSSSQWQSSSCGVQVL